MQEIRCNCGRLLAKAIYISIEIKCPRCKALNYMKVTEPHTQAPRVPEQGQTRGKTTNKNTDAR
jgi:phage FluMu protein Com